MTSDRILVTGAAGFLGSAIVRQAIGAGLKVTATDLAAGMTIPGVDLVHADILHAPDLTKLFDGVDCVCHAAGLAHVFDPVAASKAPFHAVNVEGAENVARIAAERGVKQFVFISSVSVYGGAAHGIDESAPCRPEGAYAESKLEAEGRLVELCQKSGMRLVILRLATLYGEGDPGNVARLIGALARGRFLWVGRGENRKSLLHRDDAARACMAVIASPASGIDVYNVSAPACKMKEIVGMIGRALGREIPSWHVPASLALHSAKAVKCLSFNRGRFGAIHATVQKWLADDEYNAEKFKKAFHYRTEVGLEEGIAREVEWYKARAPK
jgi:nucleoside-diphosphate-sugar epimerase